MAHLQLYVADGFTEDCEEIMHHCRQLRKVTYDKFADIWKKMNFGSIYYERKYSAEVAELSEEVIHIAKKYMVSNISSFEESVAGLFLVYGLLNLQPFKGFAALRLIPEDVKAIKYIEEIARSQRRIDVLYILGSILIHGPCQFHAALREHGLEGSLRKYTEGGIGGENRDMRPKGIFNRQSIEHEMIQEISRIDRLYSETKAFFNKGQEVDVNLSYTDKNLPSEIEISLKEVIIGLLSEEEKPEVIPKPVEDHSVMVQEIKSRAMKNCVESMKHLTGISERKAKVRGMSKKPASDSSPEKSNSDSAQEITTPGNLPTTRKRAAKSRTIINRRKRMCSSSSDSSVNGICLRPCEDYIESDTDTSRCDTTNKIVIESLAPAAHSSELVKDNQIILEVDGNATSVDVDLIPIVINSTSMDQDIEFEVVDHFVQNKGVEGEPKTPEASNEPIEINADNESAGPSKKSDEDLQELNNSPEGKTIDNSVSNKKKITRTPKKSLKTVGKIKSRTRRNSEYSIRTRSSAEGLPVTPNLCRKNRKSRAIKKTILRSKFKKMGMLSLASFVDIAKTRASNRNKININNKK